MRAMLLSNAAKSRSKSSRNWRRSSSCFCRELSRAAASSALSGGGVGSLLGVETREPGVRRRLVIRLKGFSSTFRRRDL